MRIQKKILLTLTGFIALAILLSIVSIKFGLKRERLLIDYNVSELKQITNAIADDQELKVFQIIYDYTYWDEFIDFVKNPDKQWADDNLGSILSSFSIQAVYVLNIEKDIVYTSFEDQYNELGSIEFDIEVFDHLNTHHFINYYVSTPFGFAMIQGATLHPTKDPGRLTEPQAYFFIIKILDSALLKSMEKISGCRVSVYNTKPTFTIQTITDLINSIHVLESWNKEEVGFLVFTKELDFLQLYRKMSLQMQGLFLFSIIAILVTFVLLLSRLVNKPLRLISEIVKNEDLTKVSKLKKSSAEFEYVGNMIEQFVEQKKDLEHAMHLAQASDKIKTEFLNNISHEVRTPLNGIIGAASLLSFDDISEESHREIISVLNLSTKRLLRTITQYMDISLLSSDNMPVYETPIEIFDFLRPLISEYQEECQQKNLEWVIDFPVEYHEILFTVDKSLLDKVLSHLLDNAVMFTEKGSVTFRFKIREEEIAFFIEDTGVGIDQEVKPRIFKVFSQEDASSLRRHEGSGLGLAICFKIIQLMGGRISFESEKGVGSNFYFTIPLLEKTIVLEKEDQKIVILKTIDNPIVLIAEDEDSNFFVLKAILEKRMNAKVIRAFNGLEAVDVCRVTARLNLILMDLKMPVMDGFEATSIIKKEFKNIPIVAITAYGMTGDEQHAQDVGCDDYITKPFKTNALIESLNKFLIVPKS
ncbi:MAG: hypothetical protein CVT92_08515 [Bacteroidetes bacterium HGW-Bacteroidetes-1]|jgi:signal transduction histidine kinase/CheY-like chemotaxis protein|nr:MAG: hypothetical protein CVT92_08515 [Bacteroidetes bacterium HGW-Bacteroidetes-1]